MKLVGIKANPIIFTQKMMEEFNQLLADTNFAKLHKKIIFFLLYT